MTNIFKVDEPIRRSLYFVTSALISICVILEGQVLQPWTIDVLNNNIILINCIEIPIAIFFTYLYLMNDSKRLWEICGSKKFGIIIASMACLVKVINDLLYFFKVIDLFVGLIIFVILSIYYLFVLFLPKNSLACLFAETGVVQDEPEDTEETAETQEPESTQDIEENHGAELNQVPEEPQSPEEPQPQEEATDENSQG